MPAVWLSYACLVVLYDPMRYPTAVRRVYDRALVSLPASKHDRVWDDYLAWVTEILPVSAATQKGRAINASGSS